MSYGTNVWSLAVTDMGLFAASETGVYVTVDYGAHWRLVSNGLTDRETTRCLAVSGSNLFVSNYTGVFLSINAGKSWKLVNEGLANEPNTWALAVHGLYLFVGTVRGGIYRRLLSDTEALMPWRD